MTTWIRFKRKAGDEVIWDTDKQEVVAVMCRGDLFVGGIVQSVGNCVHPCDAERVWEELCARCWQSELGSANGVSREDALAISREPLDRAERERLPQRLENTLAHKPQRTGRKVRRVDEMGYHTYMVGKAKQYAVSVWPSGGFPASKLDDLGQFIAECVGGHYVGVKP